MPSVAPLFLSQPPGVVSNAAQEAIELAESAGLILDPWQQHDLAVMLGEDEHGDWAGPIFLELVPRQNGKGGIAEARELAGLFLFDEQVLTHTAHEVKTSNDSMRRMLEHIESTPDLDREVKKVLRGNNEKSIELRSGQRLRYLARSKSSGRGLTGEVIVLDEAYDLPTLVIDALIPSMSAGRNARPDGPGQQLILQSTPPIAGQEVSKPLRQLMRIGRAGSNPKMGYVEYAAAGNEFFDLTPAQQQAFIRDESNLENSNPALDVRVDREFVREIEMTMMTPESFARERLGIIYLPSPDEESSILPNWSVAMKDGGCAVTTSDGEFNPTMSDPVSLAIDVSPGSRTGSIGGAGAWGERILVELIDHRSGTGWIVPRLLDLRDKWDCRDEVLLDPAGPAGALIPTLEKGGIPVRAVTAREHAQAVEGLFADVKDGALTHICQPELDAAVAAAVTRKYGDLQLLARSSVEEDISPLVVVGLARWGHLQAQDEDGDDFVITV